MPPNDPPLPALVSLTVGEWERTEQAGRDGRVVFIAYTTIRPPGGKPVPLPLQRFTVEMRWEDGSWRLVDRRTRWLTPSGPLGEPGDTAIRALPERDVID